MAMNGKDFAPIIINLPYGQYEQKDFKKAVDEIIERRVDNRTDFSAVERLTLQYLLAYPTVYVVYSGKLAGIR